MNKMPDNMMMAFAGMPFQAAALAQVHMQSVSVSFDIVRKAQDLSLDLARRYSDLLPAGYLQNGENLLKLYLQGARTMMDLYENILEDQLGRLHR